MRFIQVAFLITWILLLSNIATRAAVRTASVSGNWSSTTTWGGSSAPGSGDTVIINSGITIIVDVAAECTTIDFVPNTSHSTLRIYGTNSLIVEGLINMPAPNRNARNVNVQVDAGTLVCDSITMNATTGGRRNHLEITTGTATINSYFTMGGTSCYITFTDTGTLNIGGTVSGIPTMTTVAGSTINYTSSGNQTIIPGDYKGTLGCSGAGTKTLIAATTVNETLNLTEGQLESDTYLTIGDGVTINRSEGSISGSPTFSGTVDVVYSGGYLITSGSELPTTETTLNDLTLNTGGVVQGGTQISPTILLYDEFDDLNEWTGDVGSQGNLYKANSSSNAGGTSKECRYNGGDDGGTDYTAAIYQIVSTTEFSEVNISWKQFIDNNDPVTYPFSLKVQSGSSNTGPWTDIYSITPGSSADIGPETKSVTGWTTDVGGDFYIRLLATGYTYGVNYWYVDDLLIEGQGYVDSSTVTVNGNLDLTNGDYSIATNKLAINGTLSGGNDIIGGSTSELIIGGSGANFSVPAIMDGLMDFTVTRPNGATFTTAQTLTGDLTVASGSSLTTGAYSHSVGGNLINDGTLTTTGSTITFDGTSEQKIKVSNATTFNNVIIDNASGVSLDNDALATVSGTLTINSGCILEIDTASNLTITGTLTNNAGTSGLVIRSDTTSSGSLIHNTAGVNATVERYMLGNRWHIVSPPLSGQDINDFLTDADNNIPTSGANYGMMEYSESVDEWLYFTAATAGNLQVGSGYLLRNTMDTTVWMYGALNTSQVDVSVTRDAYGWNAIGNPFPSSIGVREDAYTDDDFLTYNAAEFDPSFAVLYIWDEPEVRAPSTSYWKVVGNSGYSSSKTELDQAYLQPGQGFLIRAKEGGGTMSFTTDMRVHENTGTYFKSTREPWPGLNLIVKNETASTSTAVTFHANMTNGLDVTYDAGLFGGDSRFRLYSRLVEDNGINFMLQCLPDNGDSTIIPIGLDYKEGGLVNFSAETVLLPEGFNVILEDRLLNIFTKLNELSSEYSVVVDANTSGIGRFYLHTYQAPMAPEEPEEPVNLNSNNISPLLIYSYGGDIIIKGEITGIANAKLYNLAGSLVRTYELMPSDLNVLPADDVQQGIYIVKISGKTVNENKKILLNQ